MAGLLAYAAEGGLAGAGKGIEQVGATLLKDQVDQGLTRLQNDYATKRQTAEFGHQEGMEKTRENFEEGLKEKEITASTNTATAGRQERAQQATEHETAATRRAEIAAKGRVDAAGVHAAAASAGKNQPKQWKVQNITVTDFSKGYPINTSKPLQLNPNNGKLYAQVGNKLVLWNTERNAPQFSEQALNRVPVDPSEMNRLFKNPNAIVPMGLKGSGLTEAENFERVHGYLPSGITSHMTGGGMVTDQNPMSEEGEPSDGGADNTEASIAADDEAPAKEP